MSRFCRESVRCLRCIKPKHVARNCRVLHPQPPASMQRAVGFHPTTSKVFVPFSEGYYTREQQRRNAVLANVVGEVRLGHFPKGVIANDLANRYGGFANDFMVARHWEKDFVLFLPVWVRPEDLFNRGTIRLANCRLSCFAWNPFRGALRSQLSYKAWIRLYGLPYECWTEAGVSAIVNGFERYLRADEASASIHDLSGFCCQVGDDDIADIPETLAITLGDVTVSVTVHLESTVPYGGDDRGTPFAGGDHREGGD